MKLKYSAASMKENGGEYCKQVFRKIRRKKKTVATGLEEGTILTETSQKLNGSLYNNFSWVTIGTSGGLLYE
jgi:hypothetical protein